MLWPVVATAQTAVVTAGGSVTDGHYELTCSVGQTAVMASSAGYELTEGVLQPCRVERERLTGVGEAQVEVYPNPTAGVVTLTRTPQGEAAQVALYAADGRLLTARKWADAEMHLDMTALPAGVYVLKINQSVFKITKQ